MDMTHTDTIPPVSDLKDQARRLRQALSSQGTDITHSRSLELLARQYGARDWNTLVAQAGNADPQMPRVGDAVSGRYMGQRFSGRLKGLSHLAGKKAWQVAIQLDQPIDVVEFDSFSSFRHRITGTIGADGVSFSHRSDGHPHLALDLSRR
jgi:hypothetical protein